MKSQVRLKPRQWLRGLCVLLVLLSFVKSSRAQFQTKGEISISEGAVIGTKKLLEPSLLPGRSLDAPLTIVDGNEGSYFQLQITKSEDGRRVAYIHVETRKKLDREVTPNFNLNITDGQGFLDLSIKILDINDNPPVFEQSEYKVNVNESVPIGTSLITVKANDADEGKNAELDYSISSSSLSSVFKIDSKSGLISVRDSLKCDKGSCATCLKEDRACSLIIVASDRGRPRQSAQVVVKVALLETNNHAPKILFRLPNQAQSFATVNELASAGTSVAAITVTDADKGPHGKTELSIIDGNQKGHFELQSTGSILHVLRVSSRARFQRGSDYNLTLRAKDFGVPSKSSEAVLLVKVSEVNDFKPEFAKEKYEVEISESARPGSSLIVVQATDQDANSDLKYEIVEPLNSQFRVQEKSGLIITKEKLDREETEQVQLKVKVNDGSHSSFAFVNVKIMDVNDQAPRFDKEKFEFEVEENFPLRQTFAKVQAEDNDQGENGQVVYSILNNEVFGVNKITGEIFANANLDREEQEEYEIRIKASDNGPEKQLFSVVQAVIKVKDTNDNSPRFYPQEYFMDMSKDSTEFLKATDIDQDSKVQFQLEEDVPEIELEQDSGLFKINNQYLSLFKSEGVVKVFRVLGIDSDGRRSPKLAQVHVFPRNLLKNEIFEDKTYNFDIVEDHQLRQSVIGRQVGQVTVKQSNVQLLIDSGDEKELFAIDNEGVIRTKNTIDREAKSHFNLSIVAKNEIGFDRVQVNVQVRDLNDNLPEFSENEGDLEIDFRAPIGHQIHKVQCFDPDEGKNGQLQFMLESDTFQIDPETGIISLKSKLTSQQSFEVTIKASDQGQQPLTNLKSYIIKITSNDNNFTPMFDFDLYEVSLSESTSLNSEVITMSAIDLDKEEFISYAIVDNNNENKFDIFPNGKVYLIDKLDRETKAYYSVIVTATDNGLVPFGRSSTSTLVIYVTDENDNAPILERNDYEFYLKENSPSGTFIGRVSAYDLDLGRNAEINYKFASPNTFFEIDRQSGFISTKVVLDRETMTSPTLTVEIIVSDLGLIPQSTNAEVRIQIMDENDNRPEFSLPLYEAQVSEAANLGSEIVTVIAKDADEGKNGEIRFQLLDEDSGFFHINEESGKVTLLKTLDRETIDRFEITVQARDLGKPSMTSTCLLYIKVLDENDNQPEFELEKIELKISEDVNVGDTLYEFQAADQDSGVNGKLNYFLAGNNINGFKIDTETGVMTVANPLDRETRDHVDLVVNAVDNGVYPKTGSVVVSIDILDVNDNYPLIQTTSTSLSVKEDITKGTIVAKIDASDSDIGLNGEIRFKIKNKSNAFEIDEKTGEIRSKEPLDREVKDKYELLISAQDRGSPPLSVERIFTINIEDVNDNAPMIHSLNTALLLSGSPRGTPVMTVRAKDEDSSTNAVITYRLREPSRLVKINSMSGEVTLIQDYNNDLSEPMTLTVIASDGAVPSARKSSTATLTIIGGRAQPGLSFTTELYETTIQENSPKGTPVITTSLNGDPQERVQFFVVGCESERGKGRGLFSIDKNSGQVVSDNALDRETEGSTIILHIVALIGNDKMSGTKVKITLQDENDSKPKFDDNFNIVLSEAYLPGHQIGFARATDADSNSIISYSLGLATQNFMSIDAQSGELTLTSSIDRESIDHLEVVVMASDGLHTTEWTKIVPIIDINDNAPTFITPQFSFDIPENVERGAFVGKIEAEDLDENEKITYSFISDWGLDTFSIDPATGIITLSGNQLDYESIEHYILTVSASDSGDPVLTATSTVYVNVLDVNDNPPVIEKSTYEVLVLEDVPPGSAVVEVKATDRDSEEKTHLQYDLDDSVKNVFDILQNGTIVTKTRLDRETLDFYSFKVTVADNKDTQTQFISTCVIQVTLEDVNDQVPLFESDETLSIPENSPENSPIAAIRAIDKDLGRNAEISYLLEDSLGGKFSIGRIDGVLRSVKTLDREEQESYTLSVTAIDNGTPRLSSRVEITVNVMDINDNPPKFQQKQYSASVLENVSIGMDILHAHAFDNDVGDNGRLRFTILSGDPRSDFEINESNGVIRVAKGLDHEKQSSYSLIVQVQDEGLKPQSDTAEISILIIDTNDNAPEFEHSPYLVHVVEETKADDPIFIVQARDRDTSPEYNELEYSIRAGGLHDELFHLNASTGEIYVKTKLDREETEKMTLEILAIDSGSPRLTGTGTIYVVVEDINDHEPMLENDVYDFSIMENSDIGSKVGQVQAYDKDSGDNGNVKYEIQGTLFFDIDNQGFISTRKGLDRETIPSHEFEVIARDQSKINPLSSSAKVLVEVLDENDNRPEFEGNSTDYFIPPGLKNGDFILGLFASDQDSGQNAKMSFSLNGKDAKMFNINRLNGVVTASNAFLDKKSYDITVTVSDSSMRRDARLNIYLAEELVVPTFDEASTPPEVNLDEDVPLGSNVATFKAFGDLSEDVKYAIAGGNNGKVFDVDPNTGIVYVNQTLDYETYERYELWIKSFYETRPLFSAAKKISVVITDKNDNAPRFESTLIKAEITEELYPPFDIGVEVFAYDPDTGANGEIKYALLDEKEDMFSIDEETGLIKCHKQLDRETLDHYTLKVEARDNGRPRQLSSTATVLLKVLDVNDNPPRFTRLHSINVTENTAIGTNLLKIETVDFDIPPNNEVKYTLINNPDEAFAIHDSLGNISIVKNLDREIRDEYALKVQASDGVWTLDTVITVTIQDANDNPPIFDQDVYEFQYVNGTRVIGKVHALDRDAVGPNSEVTYELSHIAEFFNVDEISGEIFAKEDLMARTSNDSYQLRVIVKDGGSPPMSSECQILINLMNTANHAPKFNKDDLVEEIGVPRNLPLSSVIMKLNASDEDGDRLTFTLEGGNDYFGIIDQDLLVLKPLISLGQEEIDLKLIVKDRFNAKDEEMLKLFITNDNLFAPEFQAPTSRIYIREDETVGNVIITVKATDRDQGFNGQIEYMIIKGDTSEMFNIDKMTGSISVAQDLDYEQTPVYNIVIQAQDRGFYPRSATSSVKIVLQDVNDNPPTFEQALYNAELKENSPPGTFVTQMIANDLDSPKNAEIIYEFIDNSEQFEIDSKSGVIKTLQSFDFELVQSVILNIRARNPSAKNDEIAAKTLLKVNIRGENEFFPKFKQPVFQFAVSESAQESSLVGQVEAIDNDAGPDGDVFYYFVGSSNNAGFRVDKRTGIISVGGNLDRESQNRYVLTIVAKNRGSIRGNDTDEAQVIVQVQDGNDPPVFRKSKYLAKITEGSAKGTKVVQVSAVDNDVRPRDSQFIYVIADGNGNNTFSIGPNTGDIIVETDDLDREKVPRYNLTIQAVDNGSPPAIGETIVLIELEDVNDSPPELTDKTAYIKENSPPSSYVAQLTASDPDLPPNAAPFKFKLVTGTKFFTLDADSGILLTKQSIDREKFDSFDLTVEVKDAGGLTSLSNLLVEVGDENDNPSRPRKVQVIIKNFEGTFPGGEVLQARPDDPDLKGNYQCNLVQGPENIFIVNEDCSVTAGRIHNGREYDLDIMINDGKHEDVLVQIKLNFISFSEFAVQESVSLRFKDVQAEQVLGFFESIGASIDNRLIELLSMNTLMDGSIECFVASREKDLFLPREDTIDHLDSMIIDLPVIIDYDPCDENPCLHQGKCSKETVVLKQTEISESGNTIFNSPILTQNVTCQCQPEYSGDRCKTQKNPCIPNPCQDGQCFQQGDSFRCLCPPLRGGKTCEVEKINACLPNPCLNGGSCQNAKNNGFFCLCRPGYQGELCQAVIDTCRQNPCLNGGTCISLNPNYKCRCHDHFYGNHCEHSTFGFEELSFATFPPLDANTNDISVIFATSKSNSLLVYNFGKSAGGRSDFLSVELVDGHPRLSWGGSRTAITRLSLTNKRVDTGRWYKVTATRNNRVASLSVEDCTESGEYCKACQADDPRCFTREVGEAGTLVFHKNPMFFGGINDESAIIDRPGQLEALDFVGCIRSISINGNEKNLFKESLNYTGLKDTCNYVESGSCSRGDECGSSGTCIPLWSHNKCKCGFNEILALDCGPSFKPFTLTENQEIRFKPTRLFRHETRLPESRWKRDLDPNQDKKSLSITFRTLTSKNVLLEATNNGLAFTKLLIREDGVLEYHSKGSLTSSNEVILDTNININDGSWHTATISVNGNVLHFLIDDVQVGFEVEFSAVHNFMDPNLREIIIGGSTFRGCITNFTLNNELQSLQGVGSRQLLEAKVPPRVHLEGCDVEILRVAQPQTALDVGVTIAIAFFVTLLFIMAISYIIFKTRGRFLKSSNKISNAMASGGHVNQSFDMQPDNQLNNSRVPLQPPTTSSKKPDIIEAESVRQQVPPRFANADFDNMAEHYDIENASSIAPSDIDIVYHYKGYREGHRGRSLPKKKGRNNVNTPLARLSPSSEMSHNTPRILTLKDLSGKPLPTSLLTEQSERSLNSPVSHFSSSSRNMRSGLTSENVARFNNAQRSTTPKNTSTLVNTLDLVSMGSGSRKKAKTPTSNIIGSGSTTTSSSSDEDHDDDSFTCSEYECDSTKGLDNGVNGGEPMNFSKLMDIGAPQVPTSRSSSSRRRYRTSDEDEEEDVLQPPRPDSRSWENLLTWWPDYESFAGVFKDIAELPHINLNPDNEVCGRPPPLGEHHERPTDEEYI